MSLFGTLLSKIFPASHPSVAAANAPASPTTSPSTSTVPTLASPSPGSASGTAAAAPPVDVAAILNGLAQKSAEKLNWRTSIVDLMKLVGMDSSI